MKCAKFNASLYIFQMAARFQKLTPLEPNVSSPLMKNIEKAKYHLPSQLNPLLFHTPGPLCCVSAQHNSVRCTVRHIPVATNTNSLL